MKRHGKRSKGYRIMAYEIVKYKITINEQKNGSCNMKIL